MSQKLFFFLPDLLNTSFITQRFPALRTIRDLGFTGFRFFEQFSWDIGAVVSPYPHIAYWRAGYPDAPLIRFYDQGSEEKALWDENWLIENRLLANFLRSEWPSCEIIITAHDYCSFRESGWRKYLYPFLSSAPDRDYLDPNYNKYRGGFWGMGEGTVQFLHKRYIEKLMELYDGLNYYIEFCNEDAVIDWTDGYANQFYKWLLTFIPKERLIVSGRWSAIQPGVVYSQHGIIRPESTCLPSIPKELLLLSGDGAFNGSGSADEEGRRGLGEAELEPLVSWIKAEGFFGYEYMDRGMWRKNNVFSNFADIDFAFAEKVASVFFEEPELPKVKMIICRDSGMIPTCCCPEKQEEEFIVGDEPREICSIHYPVSADICLESFKIARPWCRDKIHVTCSQDVPNFDLCDKCEPSCSYFWKRKNYKKFFKCLLRGIICFLKKIKL